jgi:hypothetical protein
VEEGGEGEFQMQVVFVAAAVYDCSNMELQCLSLKRDLRWNECRRLPGTRVDQRKFSKRKT